MIFHALSYLYWRCDSKGNGEWTKYGFNQSGALRDFMVGMGYSSNELNTGMMGSRMFASSASNFKDLTEGLQAEQTSFPKFLKDLHTNGQRKLISSNTDHSLSVLHYIGSLYFNGKQRQKTKEAKVSPTTIREMLYFLGALPFSPLYDSLSEHISSLFKALSPKSSDDDAELLLPVAISGSLNKTDYLNPDKMRDYLANTCFLSAVVLGRLQGNSADSENEPWLHSLFCNSQFSLAYTAGASLFHAIANYAYALQFQLSFLYQQCSLGATQGCCWRQCRYGQSINKNFKGQVVHSHICPVKCIQAGHNTGNHPQNCEHENCGQGSNPSPLQAFLTDSLSGFSVSQNPDLTSLKHLENHPPGYMCHVKMGFQPTDLRSFGSGHYIYYTLEHFCGFSNDPLRQLSEKLSCLTKGTPRTLGDMLGFIWHLNGQLFGDNRPNLAELVGKFDTAFNLGSSLKDAFTSDPYSVIVKIWNKIREIKSKPSSHTKPSSLSLALAAMAPAIPFLYQLFMMENSESLPGKLYDLRGSSHNGSQHNDLFSLRNTVCSNSNCGPYLYPLTHSEGSTFASSHASTYLSWLVYLTDEFRDPFQNLLDEFTNMTCSAATGCKSCDKNHGSGPSSCSCDSIVQCGGVLPFLYGNGFQFDYPYTLNGWTYEGDWRSNTQSKRNYEEFSQQLSNVLSPDAPLAKLLETIDDFLYMFRFYFFYNLSSFWLCSLLLLLYFIVYGIDALHFKSHVHLPSSHGIPPIGLLTTGKAPALTKLTYYLP